MKVRGYKIPSIRQRARELQLAYREKQKALDDFFCSERYMHASSHAEVLSLQAEFHLSEMEAQRDELLQRLKAISDCPLMHGDNLAEIIGYLQYVATERAAIFSGKKPSPGTYAQLFRDAVDVQQQEAARMLSTLNSPLDFDAMEASSDA